MTVTPAAMPGARPPTPRPQPHQDPGAIPVDAPLTPPPPFDPTLLTPLPTADPRRHVPLYGIQYLRREALRLTIERYQDIDATDKEILNTAAAFAEFIRTGKTIEGN